MGGNVRESNLYQDKPQEITISVGKKNDRILGI